MVPTKADQAVGPVGNTDREIYPHFPLPNSWVLFL